MREVMPKDIIFSYQGNRIKSINIALESAEETFGVVDGLRIDCFYNELEYPLNITNLRSVLAGKKPFGMNGKLPQRGYIHRLHSEAARILMVEIKRLGNKSR